LLSLLLMLLLLLLLLCVWVGVKVRHGVVLVNLSPKGSQNQSRLEELNVENGGGSVAVNLECRQALVVSCLVLL